MGNESFITEEILRYINDNTYRYAVVIDGEWGTGKTYFTKEFLIPAIEKSVSKRDLTVFKSILDNLPDEDVVRSFYLGWIKENFEEIQSNY